MDIFPRLIQRRDEQEYQRNDSYRLAPAFKQISEPCSDENRDQRADEENQPFFERVFVDQRSREGEDNRQKDEQGGGFSLPIEPAYAEHEYQGGEPDETHRAGAFEYL